MERVNTNSEEKQQELAWLKASYFDELPSILLDHLKRLAISEGFSITEILDCYDNDYDEWIANLFELVNC